MTETRVVLLNDGYPGAYVQTAHGRVWPIDEVGPCAEGHGESAHAALVDYLTRVHRDEEVAARRAEYARDGWAVFKSSCPCPLVAAGEVCADGRCECGSVLEMCGGEWSWHVMACSAETEGALPVHWDEA